MADDDVQLTDLEVIQRYSLAVRGATASRDELVAALQADLDWLRGGRRTGTPAAKAAPPPAAAPAKAAPDRPQRRSAAPAKASPSKAAPAKAGPAAKAAATSLKRPGRPPVKRARGA